MRNLPSWLAATALLASQVATPAHFTATAPGQAPTPIGSAPKSSIIINLNSPDGLNLKVDRPNFDVEALAPLRATQAARAAAAQAQAAAQARAASLARQVAVAAQAMPVPGDPWLGLRLCESGNTYSRNSGNGYYGAYQFDLGTWGGFMGYARADLAPAVVQDAKAQQTVAARGWRPWPGCARRLGLL